MSNRGGGLGQQPYIPEVAVLCEVRQRLVLLAVVDVQYHRHLGQRLAARQALHRQRKLRACTQMTWCLGLQTTSATQVSLLGQLPFKRAPLGRPDAPPPARTAGEHTRGDVIGFKTTSATQMLFRYGTHVIQSFTAGECLHCQRQLQTYV